MTFVLPDRTRETLASAPGTGNATTAGATQGAQSIASSLTSNGDTTWATIDNGTAWETNTITRVSAGVYSRGTPFASSNAGALVNFTSGTFEIFPDLPASKAKILERLEWSAGAILSVGDGTVSLPAWSFSSDPDSGWYRIGANNIGATVAGAKVLDISTTGLGVVGTILGGNGTVSLPEFSFTSDPDTGFYRIGANNIGAAVNGAKVLDISATGLGVVGTILNGDGTVSLPAFSFTSDTDSGVYRIGANNIGIAVNAAKVLDVSATGLGVVGTTLGGDGTVSLPGFSFTSDTDSGLYRIGANNIGVAVNGAKVVDIATTGITVIGSMALSPASGVSIIDVSGQTAIGTAAALISTHSLCNAPLGNLVIHIWEPAVNASYAEFVMSNGSISLNHGSTTVWDTGGATPAAGKASIYYTGGDIRVANNVSTAARFKAIIFKEG